MKSDKSSAHDKDAARLRAALKVAREDLTLLKNFLLQPNSDATGLAVLVREIAGNLGYEPYTRWLDHEISGYDDGFLGQMLGVAEDSELPRRIAGYRSQRGTVTISTKSQTLEPLPYSFFFSQPLSELQVAIKRSEDAEGVVVTIPVVQVPQENIREWLQRFGVETLPVVFDAHVYTRIITGFRRETGRLVHEFEPTLRFQEALVSVGDEKPVVTNYNITGTIANVNIAGTQQGIHVTQSIQTVTEVDRLFTELLKKESPEAREAMKPVQKFVLDAVSVRDASPEIDKVARTVARSIQKKPELKVKVITFLTKTLPIKIAEHAALSQITHLVVLLGKEVSKLL